MDLADYPEGSRRVTRRSDLAEASARRALDRIARLARGNPSRLAAFLELQRVGLPSAVLRAAIQVSGLSLGELERRAGVDRASLSRFLRGERGLTLDTVDLLAPVLGLRLRARKPRKPARRG